MQINALPKSSVFYDLDQDAFWQHFDCSKLKEFADNFELDKNGRNFSRRVENTVGEGEITR